LRVIAVARPQDEALVKRFGAETVVPRGDAAVRGLHDAAPGGVDGLIDAAVLDAAVLLAIRDGGKLATLRAAETFPPERAADAQRKMDAGGIRGRLVIVF